MDTVKKYLDLAFTNPYSKTVLTLIFVLYGGMVAPRLPGKIRKLFENNIFRVILLSLIVYTGHKDPKFSILIAAGFVISMETLRKFKMQENFEDSIKNVESFTNHQAEKCLKCKGENLDKALKAVNLQNFDFPKELIEHKEKFPDTIKDQVEEYISHWGENLGKLDNIDGHINKLFNKHNDIALEVRNQKELAIENQDLKTKNILHKLEEKVLIPGRTILETHMDTIEKCKSDC